MNTSHAIGTRGRLAIAIGVIGALGSALAAANKTADLNVNASVANNCTLTTGAIAFGAYDPVGANATAGTGDLTGNGHVYVACTKGAAATIDLGNGGAADANSRRLTSGANNLTYQLYRSDGTTVWGAGAATGGVTYSSTSKAQTDLVVVGKVPGGQDVPAGTYTNTIVATVNF
jgi:spore coat protein U-like protein